MSRNTAEAIIAQLDLSPHPEGGWFRETWRADCPPGKRASATAILFLLEAHDRSHWHKVDATELWLWHAGAPLTLSISTDKSGPVHDVALDPDVLSGELPQVIVPADQWQAARPLGGWALVSCVVSPGFEFNGFELAPAGWEPDRD